MSKQSAKLDAEALFPPKQIVNHTTHGKIDASYLDINQQHVRKAEFPESHKHHHHHHETKPIKADPYLPVRYENKQHGLDAFGLLFHENVVFKLALLEELLHSITGTERVKGVFRTERGWYSYNQTGNEITAFHPSAYRKDSRVEIIAIDNQKLDLSKFSDVIERTILSYEG